MTELGQLNTNNQSRNKELEQYGTRLCFRIECLQQKTNQAKFTKSLFKESNVSVPDISLD